ncbi:MAG: alpha/beta fold hydrolase [Oligoflexales bacterium]
MNRTTRSFVLIFSLLLATGALGSFRKADIAVPGTTTHVAMYVANETAADTIVLVHGLGRAAHKDWDWLSPKITSSHKVVLVDLPEFGASPLLKKGVNPSLDLYASAIKAVIQKEGKGKVCLVGHSLGGATSLLFASKYPEMIDRLVLLSPAGVLHRASFLANLMNVYNFGQKTGRENFFTDLFSNTALISDIFIEDLSSKLNMGKVLPEDPLARAGWALIHEDFKEAVETLRLPTLIIWGENDRVTPVRTGYGLAHVLPQADIVVFPKGDHVSILRDEATLGNLRKFLAGEKNTANIRTQKKMVAKIGTCLNNNQLAFTGVYESISLTNCKNVEIKEVATTSLTMQNSSAIMLNSKITSNDEALVVSNGKLVVAGSDITSAKSLKVRGEATLDIAGSLLKIEAKEPVEFSPLSVVIYSWSRLESTNNRRMLHGFGEDNCTAGCRGKRFWNKTRIFLDAIKVLR